MTTNNVAVLHGNYLEYGGGEYVADKIAACYDAPVYYGFGNDDVIPTNGVRHECLFNYSKYRRIVIDKIASRVHQFRDLLFMWHGQHIPELYDYDTIIVSGNEFGWYVPKDDQTIIKYVHSTPRGSYDLFWETGMSEFHRAYSTAVRTLYRPTTSFVDTFIANSELVQRRIRKYWDKPSQVVYPPVELDGYSPGLCDTDPNVFLTYNRLYRHKRTREIIRAFNDLPNYELIVGGKGPELTELREVAGPNVTVRGYLGEDEKRELLSRAAGVVYNPINEDFGMVPIESFASGTPVIGCNDGFTKYQIKDGVNGVLFDGHDVDSVYWGVRRFIDDGVSMSEDELAMFATQFGLDRFNNELRMIVNETKHSDSITTVKAWE